MHMEIATNSELAVTTYLLSDCRVVDEEGNSVNEGTQVRYMHHDCIIVNTETFFSAWRDGSDIDIQLYFVHILPNSSYSKGDLPYKTQS